MKDVLISIRVLLILVHLFSILFYAGSIFFDIYYIFLTLFLRIKTYDDIYTITLTLISFYENCFNILRIDQVYY